VKALLLAAVILAGCAAPGNPYEPDLSEKEAAARIVVQDNQQRRVPEAFILLKPSGVTGFTDDQGIFMALDLQPGNHTAIVNADGYADGTRSFRADSGKTTEVVLIIDKLR
jgi:hypothetical protein